MERSYSGGGIGQVGSLPGASAWIVDPPRNWSARSYVKAIQLRTNMLPTKGIPSNPEHARRCRAGCNKVESLSHVLQACPVTYDKRIRRHDHLCQLVGGMAKDKGWEVEFEPKIRMANGELRKPDILLSRGGRSLVVELAVHWEGPRNLRASWQLKMDKYNTSEFIKALSKKKSIDESAISIGPVVVGARGGWTESNDPICDMIGLTRGDRVKIVTDTAGRCDGLPDICRAGVNNAMCDMIFF